METHSQRKRTRLPRSYQNLDFACGVLILLIIVLSPWLFGTTERWSVLTLSVAGLLLGLSTLGKAVIRRSRHLEDCLLDTGASSFRRSLTIVFFLGSSLLLLFAFISALNARATYIPQENRFEYHEFISWLPFSYDRARSWQMFWMYAGLAGFFWGLFDWIHGRTGDERHENAGRQPVLPGRLKMLLWILSLNGALLALEGILQRLSGTTKLLWLREGYWDHPLSSFASFSYRGNAAQYFNLVWPMTLGLWWCLQQEAAHSTRMRVGSGPHILLLPFVILMTVAAIYTSSRGGMIICAGLLLASVVMLLFFGGKTNRFVKVTLISLLLIGLGGGVYLSGHVLRARIGGNQQQNIEPRAEIYKNAQKIITDYPWYGTGPGSFAAIYQLYREDSSEVWHAYLHNDWLEMRVNFGWIGFVLALALLGIVITKSFLPAGLIVPRPFQSLLLLNLGGILLHARFDFPLQIYSTLLLVFLVSCLLFASSPRSALQRG
ncbi:MAG: O-antigen ligase family protein [Verrucomicrobiota bacterium]|nr:O-antigen ligase family protein [Verrucomicrobiota bacterium]